MRKRRDTEKDFRMYLRKKRERRTFTRRAYVRFRKREKEREGEGKQYVREDETSTNTWRERGGGEFEKVREVKAGSSRSLLPPSKGLN